jgi:hypothetical protein
VNDGRCWVPDKDNNGRDDRIHDMAIRRNELVRGRSDGSGRDEERGETEVTEGFHDYGTCMMLLESGTVAR